MKASELVTKLEAIIKEYGDREIEFRTNQLTVPETGVFAVLKPTVEEVIEKEVDKVKTDSQSTEQPTTTKKERKSRRTR